MKSLGYGNEVPLHLGGKIGEKGAHHVDVKRVRDIDEIDEEGIENTESIVNSEDLEESSEGS